MFTLGVQALVLGGLLTAVASLAHLACIVVGRVPIDSWVRVSAGLAPGLPFTRVALVLISAVFLARAFAFPLLKPVFPENSNTFWWASSGICLVLGLLYAVGVCAVWS